MIVELDWTDKEEVRAVSTLHKRLLGDSPIPQLGGLFMAGFYYRDLAKDGLLKCDLYKSNGDYVAFAVYTEYPLTFMAEGRRRHFFRLCAIIFLSVIMNPVRLMTIIKVLKMSRRRGLEERKDGIGEMLSFGVLEPYRDMKDETTKLRIANTLFERTMSYFKGKGFKKMCGEIRKNNVPALLLWKSYGAVPEGSSCSREGCSVFSVPL